MAEEKCSICISNIEDKCHTTPCNHKFHEECIDKWKERNNTCPICREKICDKNIRLTRFREEILETLEITPPIISGRTMFDIYTRWNGIDFNPRYMESLPTGSSTLPPVSNSQIERMFYRVINEMRRHQNEIINASNSDEMKRIINEALMNIIMNGDSNTRSTERNSIDRPFYRFES